eukprot:4208641-Pyramimonas_sp.AAC.1
MGRGLPRAQAARPPCLVSKCGSRLSAPHTRSKHLQAFQSLRAGRFQNVALALARFIFIFDICKRSTD